MIPTGPTVEFKLSINNKPMNLLPPVCILTAGKGTRMGPLSDVANKSLLPIGPKAAISHIIDGFPEGTPFVIALGYKGEQVRQYLHVAHPELDIQFVEVDNFDGVGSGPGYSLSRCMPHLNQPFYFISCDTLFEIDWKHTPDTDWLAVAPVPEEKSEVYCNVVLDGDRVTKIVDKMKCPGSMAFTGLMFIKRHELFWDALKTYEPGKGEWQISTGLQGLMKEGGLRSINIHWTDLGDHEKYSEAVLAHSDYDFTKPNEFIYFVNHRVIKFFSDAQIIRSRVDKASIKPDSFPSIDRVTENFYSYPFVEGNTLYQYNTPKLFLSFLEWMKSSVWTDVDVPPEKLKSLCMSFYKEKTLNRLQAFADKYPDLPPIHKVNDETIAPLSDLMDKIPWGKLCDGKAAFMHGDLQFDNILYDRGTERFILLDWRQDFVGEIEYGDIYYDLAKLYGGIILNYDYIKLNLFSFENLDGHVRLDFAQRYLSDNYMGILADFIDSNGYDLGKVKLLVALIYLNMAPLHHYPFDIALYALGNLYLMHELDV